MRSLLRWIAPLLVGALTAARAAEPPLVALVFSEASFRQSPQGEGKGARTVLESVAAALDSAGVAHARLKDSDVAAGGLKPYAAALFPYSFVWPPEVVAATETYVKGGGKALFFYAVPEELTTLLGVHKGPWESREPRPLYAALKLRPDLVPGLPPRVQQDSHSVHPLAPAADDAELIGEWLGPDGQPLGLGGLVLSPRGAVMGHVLTPADTAAKGRMLLAVLGKLVPAVWERASARALVGAEKVGPLEGFDALAARIEAARVPRSNQRRAEAALAEAREQLDAARQLVEAGRHAEVLESVQAARRAAERAFALSSPERRDEFRATWIHTAYGVKDWGWRRSIRHLRDMGFNAIIPNMLWAGVAHYPSKVLPVSPEVEKKGDQIAECLRWCRRYGVELHVWKVNYNLSGAPKGFVEQLRAEGRLQRHRDGSEILWLCPSDPRNLLLERESMLEVVRNYEVNGIHFDYIRYPHGQACFCGGCRERFEKAAVTKVAQWPDDVLREPLKDLFAKWRQEQVTNLVRSVATEARRIRPGVLISAAVFQNWERHRFEVGQDWKLWIEEGLLDFVCPMDYTAKADQLADLVAKQVGWVNGRVPLYPGIGAWQIRDLPGLVDQLERARDLGADGFVCFHYDDRTFTDDRLPLLHLSHTATRTRPPHPAPRVDFVFPPAAPERPGLAYSEGTEMEFGVTLRKEGSYAKPPGGVSGRLTVETTDGQEVCRIARLRPDEKLRVLATFGPGRYRLAVRGTVSFGWFSGQPYVVRGKAFEVVGSPRSGPEEPRPEAPPTPEPPPRPAEQPKRQPPRFRTAGLRVGVVAGGYGSQGVLKVLEKQVGTEAIAIQELTAEHLKPCQVVVFPQPRDPQGTKAGTVEALRAFVGSGGGLLATHDAPGFRTHPVLIPEVCPGGSDRIEGTTWWPATQHPMTKGLTIGNGVPYSYYDFIALRVGPYGTAVAEGVRGSGRGGRSGPAVVCGEFGQGRYVACGLALGIDRKDAERPPTGAELVLLVNTIRWLGRQ